MSDARDVVRLSLTERDHAVLAFAAEHRLVLERQIERLAGTDRGRLRDRLRALVGAEYLTTGRVFDERYFQIRVRGLAAIDSRLPAPRLKLGAYKHDLGLAWLRLMAHEGAFGSLREVLSERRLRSHDGALERPGESYGVRLGGYDRRGNERLHYPDLLLIDAHGRRLALELELTAKGRERRESILGGYGSGTRIDHVLYLVENQPAGRALGRTLERAASEMGVSDRVHVQLVKPFGPIGERQFDARQRGPVTRQRATTVRQAAEAAR